MLQNFIENGGSAPFAEPKQKRSAKTGSHELEMLVGTVFNEVCQLLEDHEIRVDMPEEVGKAADKLSLLKGFVEQLITFTGEQKENVNSSGIITCKDCQNYEASLQKLEGEVRQHIRVSSKICSWSSS